MHEYLQQVVQRFWAYKEFELAGRDDELEEAAPRGLRPPVFFREFEVGNLLIDPELNEDDRTYLINMIPAVGRHGLFRSMKSSQALTQTVFGSLAVMGRLDLLANLETEEGERPFQQGPLGQPDLELEVDVNHLNEPRPTSKDVAFRGLNPVTVECKFTEAGIGTCSRPDLRLDNPEHCDGSYTRQSDRHERCCLTEIGVRYWQLVPLLFHINADIDHRVLSAQRDLPACEEPAGNLRQPRGPGPARGQSSAALRRTKPIVPAGRHRLGCLSSGQVNAP